jgi:hypothetical protein
MERCDIRENIYASSIGEHIIKSFLDQNRIAIDVPIYVPLLKRVAVGSKWSQIWLMSSQNKIKVRSAGSCVRSSLFWYVLEPGTNIRL